MIKIANLGVTHLLNATEKSQASFTGPGVSVDFISPEQAEEPRVIDVRSELYSLGCVFYFLLTGQPVFPGGSPVERLNRHLNEAAPSPERLRPETPAAVAEMVSCLLAKRLEDRYARPRDVAHALAPYSRQTGSSESFTVTPSANTGGETRVLRGPALIANPVVSLTALPVAPPRAAMRWKMIAGGVVACLLLGVMFLGVVAVGLARWKSPTIRKGPGTPLEPDGTSAAFRELETRARDGRDIDRVRDDLLAFRIATPASPEAVPAAELLARLPAPMDRLSEDSIPREERFEGRPRELVAVLGEHQPKPWMSERLLTTQLASGLVVTAAPDNAVRVWDLTTRATRASLPPRVGTTCAALSPDGKRLAVGSFDRFVRLTDLADGAQRWASDTSKAGIQMLAFSPDGEVVAAASYDRTIRLLEAGNGKERASWAPHVNGMRTMAFAPDGKTLVTAGYRVDPTGRTILPEVRTWDVGNGKRAKNTIDLPMTHHVTSLLFSRRETTPSAPWARAPSSALGHADRWQGARSGHDGRCRQRCSSLAASC